MLAQQLELFAEPEKKPKPKRRQKRKGIVYRCLKCDKSIEIDIPAVVVICGIWGRRRRV
jgi:hypothetical protein